MIKNYKLFCESSYNVGMSDHNVGPPIAATATSNYHDIGMRGGTNSGNIGAEFCTTGDVTAEPEPRGGFKYNVKDVKYAKDKRREKALKKLKKLNRISFGEWLKNKE